MLVFWLGLFCFFIIMSLIMVLRLGGATLKQIIKSKMPGYKHKGAWFIQGYNNSKVKFVYKKIPKDLRIKIKSGDTPQEDQYASINEIYHQTDVNGTPVLFTLEDLPFTFFLKKHHLDDFFPKLKSMINLIDEIVANKKYEEAEKLKIIIKSKLLDMKKDLKYIPIAIKNLEYVLKLDKQEIHKNKHSIFILIEYRKYLLNIREAILNANHQMVNVNDLFETVGFVKNLTNMNFLAYQNGWLAATQTQEGKKPNILLLVLIILVGLISILGGYFSYQAQQDIFEIQTQVSNSVTQVKELNDKLSINISEQPKEITDQNIPYNPLG